MGKGGSKTQTVMNETKLPAWVDQAGQSNYAKAQEIAAQPYTPYTGNMLAPWDTAQRAGYDTVMNGTWQGRDAMNAGQAAAYGAANYQPWQVHSANADIGYGGPTHLADQTQINRPDVRDVVAAKFTDANLQSYMNPYTSSVIDRTMQTLGRQNDILNNQTNARAAKAGAFGGSRQAVANSENNRAFLDTAADTAANLNNQNFAQAQQAIQTDQGRALQAWQGNQQADMGVAQANLGARQQTNLANQAALNNMGQFNAQQYQQGQQYNADNIMRTQLANQQAAQNAAATRLAGGNALNSMGLDQQRFNLNNAQAQFGMGQSVQAQSQLGLDQQYQQWLAQQQYPLQQLNILQSGLTQTPYGKSSTEVSPYHQNTGSNMLMGGLGGAMLGHTLGGGLAGWTGVGAGGGALLGLLCWVARAAYGADNPRWLDFRDWMLREAPVPLFRAYLRHGPAFARYIADKPRLRRLVRGVMERILKRAGIGRAKSTIRG